MYILTDNDSVRRHSSVSCNSLRQGKSKYLVWNVKRKETDFSFAVTFFPPLSASYPLAQNHNYARTFSTILSVKGESTLKLINIAIKHCSLRVVMLECVNDVDQLCLGISLMFFLPLPQTWAGGRMTKCSLCVFKHNVVRKHFTVTLCDLTCHYNVCLNKPLSLDNLD